MDTRTGQTFMATEDQRKILNGVLGEGENRFIELPHKPEPDCKRCQGRGTLKSWGTKHKFGACPKCYPDHEFKAQSFKDRLRGLK